MLCLSASVKRRDLAWRAAQSAIAATDATYRFDRMKSKQEAARGVRQLTLLVAEREELAAAQAGLRQGAAIAHGMSLAKDLGNLPRQCLHADVSGERGARAGQTATS